MTVQERLQPLAVQGVRLMWAMRSTHACPRSVEVGLLLAVSYSVTDVTCMHVGRMRGLPETFHDSLPKADWLGRCTLFSTCGPDCIARFPKIQRLARRQDRLRACRM